MIGVLRYIQNVHPTPVGGSEYAAGLSPAALGVSARAHAKAAAMRMSDAPPWYEQEPPPWYQPHLRPQRIESVVREPGVEVTVVCQARQPW